VLARWLNVEDVCRDELDFLPEWAEDFADDSAWLVAEGRVRLFLAGMHAGAVAVLFHASDSPRPAYTNCQESRC